jgi:hypothetical protein
MTIRPDGKAGYTSLGISYCGPISKYLDNCRKIVPRLHKPWAHKKQSGCPVWQKRKS